MGLDIAKLPDVDDGAVRADTCKFILNNDFTINLADQMHIDDLQTLTPDKPFVKIADCLLNIPENFPSTGRVREFLIEDKNFDGKLIDYKPVAALEKQWKQKHKEWVYVILYDKRIVKIGMTAAGMKERFNSYNSGSKRYMLRGTPATTNFMISQCNYLAILKGMSVEVYAQEVPSIVTRQIIYGKEREVVNRIAHEYESVLIDIYKETTGKIPFLCGQLGK